MSKLKAAIISLCSDSSQWTAEAMRKYFDEVDELDIRKIDINIGGRDSEVFYEGDPIKEYDCIYAKGSFRYAQLLKTLTSILSDKCFMPISAEAFTIAHDKLLTQLELQKNKIPMPKTYISATITAARNVLNEMKYPIIMKFPHGTGGKGVMFADSYASASSLLDALSALRQPFIIQEFVDTGGTDIRAIVIGDHVIASMKRKASINEARANLHRGGTGESIVLSDAIKKLAVKVAKAIKADICGVDILIGAKGPVVLEANISPGLQISKITSIDIADKIAEYLFEKTSELKSRKKHSKAAEIMSSLDDKKDFEGKKKLITALDFRGSKILLPSVITRVSDFDADDTYEIEAECGKVVIKKLNLSKTSDN